jgi:hypothetical protein
VLKIKGSEIKRLVAGLKPRAKVPKGFGLWSPTMILAWLKQNQKVKGKSDGIN